VAYKLNLSDAVDFPGRCAKECQRLFKTDKRLSKLPIRVCDVGCAVGAASFRLASFASEVVGIDYSQSFIDAANRLKEDGQIEYDACVEGDISEKLTAKIDASIDTKRIHFVRGDACHLDFQHLGFFDIVLAANLVCRLSDPALFLSGLQRLVRSGGYAVITTPCTWLTEFTPKPLWIGGFVNSDGTPVSTLDGLKSALQDQFEFIESRPMPFVIRETARKHQLTVAELSIWKRR